jgi:tRNA(fMet)-specific endonuclease VapC
VTWLLDTNTLVYILNGEARIRARANEAGRAGRVVTSIVVVAELLYGVERSSRQEANRRHLEKELEPIEIVPLGLGAAAHFGRLKAALRAKGVNKTDLDLLIAATALDLGAMLVTNDRALLDGTRQGVLVAVWIHRLAASAHRHLYSAKAVLDITQACVVHGQGRSGGSAPCASSSAYPGNHVPAAGSTMPHSGSKCF